MKYIYIISIIAIVTIGLGCVEKSSESVPQKTTPVPTSTPIPVSNPVPVSNKVANVTPATNITPTNIVTPKNISTQTNLSTATATPIKMPVNTTSPTNTQTVIPTATQVRTPVATTVVTTTSIPVDNTTAPVTPVTETFQIGEAKDMLGINIKLVNITDYDNDTAMINIDGVKYDYTPDLDPTIRVKGIEILFITVDQYSKTADITVDYVSNN